MKLALIASILPFVRCDIKWPKYSQQCQDDAGTPFDDDEETYGPGGKYHDGQAVFPVLVDGECAEPMKNACSKRDNYKTAYLEGPLSCGSDGWFCRIMQDENWPPINLIGDLNFGHCNSTKAFNDAGYDKDGHCHGSSDSSVYYWWIRDHFFRQYNGRVRCCCGWYDNSNDSSQSLYSSRIANRCDYRRLVTKSENLNDCRDANEGHGLGFDNIGCNSDYEDQKGSIIPENDSQCWEIGRFGYSEDSPPSPTPPSPTPPTGDECKQKKSDKFLLKVKRKNNGTIKEKAKTCNWLEKRNENKKKRICTKNTDSTDDYAPAKDVCFVSCGTGPCDDE